MEKKKTGKCSVESLAYIGTRGWSLDQNIPTQNYLKFINTPISIRPCKNTGPTHDFQVRATQCTKPRGPATSLVLNNACSYDSMSHSPGNREGQNARLREGRDGVCQISWGKGQQRVTGSPSFSYQRNLSWILFGSGHHVRVLTPGGYEARAHLEYGMRT